MPSKVVEVPGLGNIEFPDSMNDEQISAAIAKQTGHASAPQPQGVLGHVENFAKNFWGELVNSGQGMIDMATTRPDKTLGKIGEAQDQVRLKAQDALKRGDYLEAARHALSYIIPAVGPAIDARGDQAQSGDVSGALGGAASLGLQLAGPSALARTVPAPAPGTPAAPGKPLIRSTLNPVQQEAVDFLKDRDVPLNVGTVTGNKAAKAVQALAQNQPLGASVASRAARATEAGLKRVGGDLIEETSRTPSTPESAGRAIPEQLDWEISGRNMQERAAYEQAWQHKDNPRFARDVPVRMEPALGPNGNPTGGMQQVTRRVSMPVDVRDLKQQLKPVLQDMQWMPAAERSASAGYQAVKNILEGDDFIPASQAERGLSGLKAMARVDNPDLRNAGQGIAAGIIPDLQQSIDAAVAATGEDSFRALQKGRALHADKMEIADLAKQLREEPVQVFNQLTWQHDTGIDFLRRIQQHAPDQMPQIGRAFVQKLFDQATEGGGFSKTQSILSKWEAMGPETKKILYPDQALRENIGRFFKGAQMVAENPNPSGTAVVGSLIPGGVLMVQNPLSGGAWLLSGYAASKLLFSPRGVALLTDGLHRTGPAAAFTTNQILKMAGDGAKQTALPAAAISARQEQPQ